ncbi:MAG TPA: succinate dehydrogenase [Thermoanaerobaculia bacterium]|nr:succinate dehydrogenase [Thermoanaerobaculia bacterium]
MLTKAEERNFWLHRIHSLTGIVPIGGFLAFHLYENYSALRGAEHYNEVSLALQRLPFALALEIAVIMVPIFFHGIYGLFITSTAAPNYLSYRRNWMYTLQRFTGVILFAYILFHLWTTRFVNVAHHEDVNLFATMQGVVHNPWLLAFTILGILSATFHLANGIWSFSIVWGITQSPRSQRLMEYVSVVVFVVLSLIGVRAIFAFV